MSVDPVARLEAIYSDDIDQAIAIRFPKEEIDVGVDVVKLLEGAVSGLVEQVEEAISLGRQDLTLDVETAEMLIIALKARPKKQGRQNLTKSQRLRREAIVRHARTLKKKYIKAGMSAGEAAEKAALEAESIANKLGDKANSERILDLMKRRGNKPLL